MSSPRPALSPASLAAARAAGLDSFQRQVSPEHYDRLAPIVAAALEVALATLTSTPAAEVNEPSDRALVTRALDLAIDQAEALFEATGEWPEDEDRACWEYCKRVLDAAEAGDLTPIREELARTDAEGAAS